MDDYFQAIKETKLPPKLDPRGPRCYDEAFREFVNTEIDMRDLSQHMTDFMVAACSRLVRSMMAVKLDA